MTVYKDKEDGSLTTGYVCKSRDFDSLCDYAKASDFVEVVEASDFWDVVDADVYESALDAYGLDYKAYDDPDDMWDDFMAAYKAKDDKYI